MEKQHSLFQGKIFPPQSVLSVKSLVSEYHCHGIEADIQCRRSLEEHEENDRDQDEGQEGEEPKHGQQLYQKCHEVPVPVNFSTGQPRLVDRSYGEVTQQHVLDFSSETEGDHLSMPKSAQCSNRRNE